MSKYSRRLVVMLGVVVGLNAAVVVFKMSRPDWDSVPTSESELQALRELYQVDQYKIKSRSEPNDSIEIRVSPVVWSTTGSLPVNRVLLRDDDVARVGSHMVGTYQLLHSTNQGKATLVEDAAAMRTVVCYGRGGGELRPFEIKSHSVTEIDSQGRQHAIKKVVTVNGQNDDTVYFSVPITQIPKSPKSLGEVWTIRAEVESDAPKQVHDNPPYLTARFTDLVEFAGRNAVCIEGEGRSYLWLKGFDSKDKSQVTVVQEQRRQYVSVETGMILWSQIDAVLRDPIIGADVKLVSRECPL